MDIFLDVEISDRKREELSTVKRGELGRKRGELGRLKNIITFLLLVIFYFLQELYVLIDPILVPNTPNMDKTNAFGCFHGCPNSPRPSQFTPFYGTLINTETFTKETFALINFRE